MQQCDLQMGPSYSLTKGRSQYPSEHHPIPSHQPLLFLQSSPHPSLHSHSLAGLVLIPVFSLTLNVGSVKSPIPTLLPCLVAVFLWVPLTNEETLLPPESAILSPSHTHFVFLSPMYLALLALLREGIGRQAVYQQTQATGGIGRCPPGVLWQNSPEQRDRVPALWMIINIHKIDLGILKSFLLYWEGEVSTTHHHGFLDYFPLPHSSLVHHLSPQSCNPGLLPISTVYLQGTYIQMALVPP